MGHYRRQSADATRSAAWIYAASGHALPPPARRPDLPARLARISGTEDRVLALLFLLGPAKPVHPVGTRRSAGRLVAQAAGTRGSDRRDRLFVPGVDAACGGRSDAIHRRTSG